MMFPLHFLAYAESHDDPNALFLLVLESMGVLVGIVVVALVPLMVARGRRHGNVQIVLTGLVLWAFASAGEALYQLFARYRWSKEYATLVSSGYFDPKDTSAAPQPQWWVWIILGVAYAGLVIYAAQKRSAKPSTDSTIPDASTNGHPKNLE